MRIPAVAVVALVVGSGAAAPAKLPNPHGWGKPNISYLQYRTDVAECGYIASQVKMPDVSNSAPTMPILTPGDQAAQIDMMELYAQTYDQYTMMVTNKVVGYVEAAVDQCLESRGYRPFRVTSEQMAGLRRLPKGTAARYHYIYRLGTDPRILASQGL